MSLHEQRSPSLYRAGLHMAARGALDTWRLSMGEKDNITIMPVSLMRPTSPFSLLEIPQNEFCLEPSRCSSISEPTAQGWNNRSDQPRNGL